MDRPLIGITMGDPAGIGPEIIVKAITSSEVMRIARCLIIGDVRFIKAALALIGRSDLQVLSIKKVADATWSKTYVNVLDLRNADPGKIKIGKMQPAAGRAAMEYIQKALELATSKKIDGIATAPINKEAINKAGFKFPGHTEFLAQKTKCTNYGMMFVSDTLWIMLATTHIPLREVSKHLDKKGLVNKIKLAHDLLLKLKGKKPRIGVAGLNPHAGESGLFGEEETKIILPAVNEAKKMGIDVKGPISPDAIFYLANIGMFEAVIAMYHDQGLIPLKILSFNKSVNVSVGLPIIRTSVDHGTGFDIAGKGWANAQSMIEAIKVAAHFSKNL
ncbi:MAG: 4-hydroxythreonine-4-phosphate dehydrogenase PdxA [Candidatus Saganbacteria bacterium]|nr:4-hydroxythreonine-4-phosphate dehydrogenase PdxA [Candidatus Saganbacteria bacterium]